MFSNRKVPPSGTRTSHRAERSSRLTASRLSVSPALPKHATPTPSQRQNTLTPEPPYFEGRRGSAWTTLCQHLRQRALLRFSWLIFIGFQAQFSALKQNPNSIVFKEPEATRCRLDRLNPAVESLGDFITDWRSKPHQDSVEAGLQHPRHLPDGIQPAANRPRVPRFKECSTTIRVGLMPEETEQLLQTPRPTSRQCASRTAASSSFFSSLRFSQLNSRICRTPCSRSSPACCSSRCSVLAS